ncbi:MAG: N-6 DNA methylase, partial [Anaerolineales bacterium]
VKQGYIEGIIGLPPNLFYGTGIPACIIVLDKEHAYERKEIFFIDASKGFVKDGDKNRLRERDIHKIVDVYLRRTEEPGYSRRVSLDEIERNDFNLNIPRYIESAEPEDVHDLTAHLRGGIPDRDLDALERYWKVFPNLRARLFVPLRPGYSQLQVESREIRSLILTDPALKQFEAQVETLWNQWKHATRQKLIDFKAGDKVKPLGEWLSEEILHVFTIQEQDAALALVDKYDLYQQVMSYWQETMQDDLYLIAEQGWEQAARPRPVEVIEEDGKKKAFEKADLTIGKQGYVADLIPPSLLIARYFSDDQHRIKALQSELDDLTARMDALREEQGGEDGLLAEVIENDKISEKRIKARLKELNDPLEDDEERTALKDYLRLLECEAQTKKALKDAQTRLNENLLEKYQTLTEAEIKTLVVDDKWLGALDAALHAELERIIQNLTTRLRQLAERYAEPLPHIEREVESLRQKVREHLRRMGQTWEEQV